MRLPDRHTNNVKQCGKCGRLYPLEPNYWQGSYGGGKGRSGKNYYIGNQCIHCYRELANNKMRRYKRADKAMANTKWRARMRLAEDLGVTSQMSKTLVDDGCMICGDHRYLHGYRIRSKPVVICEPCYLQPLKKYLYSTKLSTKLLKALER